METNKIYPGDCLEIMQTWPDAFVDCCVTSPPYWGFRDYGVDGQLGLEATPEEYVAKMVAVFREVKRVLKPSGNLWLNLGDSYAGGGRGGGAENAKQGTNKGSLAEVVRSGKFKDIQGIKTKDLVGIPWMVAFALRQDGWYLRQDIIWHKPNPMPESVRDRCTKAHEYIFLLSKKAKYYCDMEAIREPLKDSMRMTRRIFDPDNDERKQQYDGKSLSGQGINPNTAEAMRKKIQEKGTANKRSVWTVTTKPYSEAHFATFPPDLIEPCILAGCPKDGLVLEPFMGSGTTAMVAYENNRTYIGCELNPEYIKLNRADKAKEKYGLLEQ